MSTPGLSTAHSVVEPTPRSKRLAMTVVVLYALITLVPLLWILLTSIKSPPDSISYPPKVVFQPSIEGLLQPVHHAFAADRGVHQEPAAGRQRLRAHRARQQHGGGQPLQLPAALRQLAGDRDRLDHPVGRPGRDGGLRVLALQGAGKDDLMFFILSTR
jgi:multiple sugar transport system permease protein